MSNRQVQIVVDAMLQAYAQGIFPMANMVEGSDELYWYDPPERAILPIRDLHISSSLRKVLRARPFEIRVDTAFDAVIDGCRQNRPSHWINDEYALLFRLLHQAGHAHSVECWQDGRLAGGVYGLALGGAFCGESMFSRVSEASKVALVHLMARLDSGGFSLFDAQIINDHTARFGAFEITRAEYKARLNKALIKKAEFNAAQPPEIILDAYLRRRNEGAS